MPLSFKRPLEKKSPLNSRSLHKCPRGNTSNTVCKPNNNTTDLFMIFLLVWICQQSFFLQSQYFLNKTIKL